MGLILVAHCDAVALLMLCREEDATTLIKRLIRFSQGRTELGVYSRPGSVVLLPCFSYR